MSDLPAAVQLQNDVKEQVKATDTPGISICVRKRVVNQLAEAEIVRRTQVLTDALTKRSVLARELKKFKPTLSQGVDEETGKESFKFTKSDFDGRKKATEKLAKLDAAIGKVIEEPTADAYGKLKDIASK